MFEMWTKSESSWMNWVFNTILHRTVWCASKLNGIHRNVNVQLHTEWMREQVEMTFVDYRHAVDIFSFLLQYFTQLTGRSKFMTKIIGLSCHAMPYDSVEAYGWRDWNDDNVNYALLFVCPVDTVHQVYMISLITRSKHSNNLIWWTERVQLNWETKQNRREKKNKTKSTPYELQPYQTLWEKKKRNKTLSLWNRITDTFMLLLNHSNKMMTQWREPSTTLIDKRHNNDNAFRRARFCCCCCFQDGFHSKISFGHNNKSVLQLNQAISLWMTQTRTI